jgi:spermidine synthase
MLRLGSRLLASALIGHPAHLWYLGAGLWQALVLLPATTAMGATIPLGMLAISKAKLPKATSSFSYLYLANVVGAVVGSLAATFVLVEVMGFTNTLVVAFTFNLGIAAAAWFAPPEERTGPEEVAEAMERASGSGPRALLVLLFFTGLCSLGMEVVWTRQFTVLVGTFVYSFASILAVYLGATFLGSTAYRALKARGATVEIPSWAVIGLFSLLPLLAMNVGGLVPLHTGDPGYGLSHVARLLVGIGPFSAALGFVTPQLVDRWSVGRPDKAGIAYAINTVGCILGPLLAGFALLPYVSTRWALALLSLPFFIAGAVFSLRAPRQRGQVAVTAACALVAVGLLWRTQSFEEMFPKGQVVRDHTATSIATGRGFNRLLLVNGIGMTVLTPITKMMAHLPLAMLEHPPKRALAICFGMGTTFRSLTTWDIDTTVVELVPGVPKLFPYFHSDAAETLAKPNAHVVIDDGRRFLESDSGQYDVIIFDPPPPVSAASSGLLYSTDLYHVAKKRLAPGGILQQWIPGGDNAVYAAMFKAIRQEFPYVLAYPGFTQGVHLLASMEPLREPVSAELAKKLSPAAAADLIEWGPKHTVVEQFDRVVSHHVAMEEFLAGYPDVPPLTDDRPINEYDFLRSHY